MIKKVFMLIFAILIFSAVAQPVFDVSTQEVDFGDMFYLRINYNTEEYFFEEVIPQFENARMLGLDTTETGISIKMLPLKEGEVEFSPEKFVFKDNSGNIIEFYNDTFSVNVKPLIIDEESEPMPPAPFLSLVNKYDIKKIIAVSIGLLLLMFIIIYLIFRRRYKVKVLRKFLEPPHVIALRELENLKLRKLVENEKQKVFCIELSKILKNYIERRYNFNASEMTTFELESHFNSEPDKVKWNEKVITYLKVMDLVKFAKYELDNQTLDEIFTFTREFIIETKEVVLNNAS
ncbi:MAG: hypothetical protein WC002_01895 [Candidatus Muiribacteriota bacterium]|jgi:hypothetical protein